MTPTSTNAHNNIIAGYAGLSLSGAPFDGLPPMSLTSVMYPALAQHMSSHAGPDGSGAQFVALARVGGAASAQRSRVEHRTAAAAPTSMAAYGSTSFTLPPPSRTTTPGHNQSLWLPSADAKHAERTKSPYPRLQTVVLPHMTLRGSSPSRA
ncbi:hypothetical protein B0H10DRAFT_2212675 [Mycena sp. CBHHK59/15]|nr:hypothetical protein B0H10DRAFT_2212675 [Mycena sp. CBHHK59/15]